MQLKPTKENRLDSNFKLLTDGHGNVIGHSQSIAYLKNNMQ